MTQFYKLYELVSRVKCEGVEEELGGGRWITMHEFEKKVTLIVFPLQIKI